MQEIELLAPGVDLNHPEKGRYYQNVYMKNGALTVRPGFGQLAQFDTTMSRVDDSMSDGYSRCLGVRSMETNFGHTQLISVHVAKCHTTNCSDSGVWTDVYSVNIYDVTTGERWEEVIHRHTSERSKEIMPIREWHGAYETHRDQDYALWKRASEENVFFEEAFDVLFFGSKDLGLRMYIPADFNGNRSKQVDSASRNEASNPYSESCLILPVTPASGEFSAAYQYQESSTLPDPIDAAFLSGRLVIARDHDVFFSDQGRPASFIGINSIAVPSESYITAIESISDNLLIFTKQETYLYQPNSGDLINNGRLNRVSENIGCIGPNAITRADNILTWVDRNGVYMSSGGVDIKKVSGPIQPFFDDRVSNPLTSRLETRNMSNSQPRSNFDANDLSNLSLAYDHQSECVFISIPGQNIIWVFQAGHWFLWNLESARKLRGIVGAVNNITNAVVSSSSDKVFIHGGFDSYTHTAGGPTTSSFYILELGRGGAMDRSVHSAEDNRDGTGFYEKIVWPSSPHSATFFIEKPQDDGWYPITFSIDGLGPTDNIQKLSLKFLFDQSNWDVEQNPAGTLLVKVPTEREDTAFTNSTLSGGPTVSSGGSGSEIDLVYNPGFSTSMASGVRNKVCSIKFSPSVGSPDTKVVGISGVTICQYDLGSGGQDANLLVWTTPYLSSRHGSDDVAQEVDWVVKSGQLGVKDGAQIKMRSLYSKLKTNGNTSVNVQFASDWTDYKGQVADTIPVTSVDGSRSHEKFWDSQSKWNDNVMVDEQPYDTVASSLSVRGEHVSAMIYGSTEDKSEEITVDSLRASYKLSGGRRRKDR